MKNLFSYLRVFILKNKITRLIWSFVKSELLHRSYLINREHYQKRLVSIKNSNYENDISRIQSRIKSSNTIINKKEIGELRIFAIISNLSWHFELLPDLKECGDVELFDYVSEGYKYDNIKKNSLSRKSMNEKILDRFISCNKERKFDVLFMYATGYEISPNLIDEIKKISNIPCISMCLDDKHTWKGEWLGEHYSGQINLAQKFELNWTTSPIARDWYSVEGGNPYYMPEGFDKKTYYKQEKVKNIPISFLGAPYGFRLTLIGELQKYNLPVYPFGPGWENYNKSNFKTENNLKNIDIINQSQINLSHGGIGYSKDLYIIKKRDFDIPGSGGMYVTSYNNEISEHYRIGKEIVCYTNIIDLVEVLRYYVDKPNLCSEIGNAGREKALKSHRWLHRYKKIFSIIGLIE